MLIPENYGGGKWVPAISVGFMARENVRDVGNLKFVPGGGISATDSGKADGDVYMVGCKQVSQLKPIPVILTAGVRGTNAVFLSRGNSDQFRLGSCAAAASPSQLPRT